jgi:catechol 2,3-dioxygenase-like lactoylglutathione lyase family enzyme
MMLRIVCVLVILTSLLWGTAMAAEEKVEQKPEINVRFLYFVCNDIDAVREFYTNTLGMVEQSYMNDEEWGWLMYQSEGMQIVIMRAETEVPVHKEWAPQPGWGGGELPIPSWSIHVPEKKFNGMVEKLISGGYELYEPKPMWAQDSYWSFPVKDPMGNTVEVYTSPAERPESTEWPE